MKNNCAISWKTGIQKTIATSSTEAEYVALTLAAKEALWFQKLELELYGFNKPTIIFEDNQSAINIASNFLINEHSKHIDIKFKFIKELIENKKIEINYCPTSEMIADILTKPL